MQKTTYKFIIPSTLVLILFFVFIACNQKSTVKDLNDCKYRANFKNEEWNGKITNKYIDQTLNNARTISVTNTNGIHKIQDTFLYHLGNYELIEIGDSISKKQGELIVYLYKSSGITKMQTDFDCDTLVLKNQD